MTCPGLFRLVSFPSARWKEDQILKFCALKPSAPSSESDSMISVFVRCARFWDFICSCRSWAHAWSEGRDSYLRRSHQFPSSMKIWITRNQQPKNLAVQGNLCGLLHVYSRSRTKNPVSIPFHHLIPLCLDWPFMGFSCSWTALAAHGFLSPASGRGCICGF